MSKPPIVKKSSSEPSRIERTDSQPSAEPVEIDASRSGGAPLPQRPKLINNRAAIFIMLFGVTGFLGIPVLCKSEAFSGKEKILWSVVVTIYTVTLIALTAWIVMWSYRQIFG